MKLGYLVSQYPARSHTFILREIRELRKHGFDVRAISVRRPDRPIAEMTPVEAEEAGTSVSILGLPPAALAGIHIKTLLRYPVGYLRALFVALRMWEGSFRGLLLNLAYFAEAVVAGHLFLKAGVKHFHVHFSSMVGLLTVKVFPIQMSITFHGSAEFLDVRSFHLREKVRAALFVRAISSFGASQIMMATDYTDWSRIETIRLGVDGRQFQPCARERAAGSVAELLYVGRLTRGKGLYLLFDALAELLAAGHRVCLRLVGDGPDRAALTERAQRLGLVNSVIFEGWANEERVREFYAQADIFVLPSFAEGIPVVLMEAMATELPVISTWVNGVPELIENDRDGLLCAPGDSSGLAAAMDRLIRCPEIRTRLGTEGRRTVSRSMTYPEMFSPGQTCFIAESLSMTLRESL